MPMILPLIAIGAALAVGTTAALVVGTIVAVGLTLALSKSMSGVPSDKSSAPSTYTTNPTQLTFQADAPRRLVYGKARISGVVAYANIAGSGHEFLYLVVVIAAHKITDITQIYFDGDAGPDVASGFYEYWWHDGSQTTADSRMMATFSEWTAACKLQGCAYAVVKLTYDKTVFKNGRPNIQFDIKGKQVYDPRDGLTKWTNNAALITSDFMTSSDGLNATYDEMDWPSVSAAADISDQIPAQMAASLCDGRYTVDGVVELSTKNGDTISQMLAACAGTVVWVAGKYRLFVGAAVTPTDRPITEEDLRDNPSLQPRTPADQSFNGVKGTFLDSTNGWVFSDFPPIVGDEYVQADGGVQEFKDIALNFTTSPITAQRLATIFLRRARLEKTITLPCKWTVFNYEVWDVVPIKIARLGWVSKLFQITDWKMTPPTNSEPGGVELTLVEYSDDLFSDDMSIKPIDGGGTIIVPDVTIPNPLSILYATSGDTAVDSSGNPRVRFDWPMSSDIYVIGYEIAYGRYPFSPSDSDYVFIAGRNSTTLTTQALTPGDTYVGYIRCVNSYEKRSAVTVSDPVVITGLATNKPEQLQGLTASEVGHLYVDLTWSPPAGSAQSTSILWAPDNDYSNGVIAASVPLPTTTIRLQREVKDGYYFAAFVSTAGNIGRYDTVAVSARSATEVVQSLTFDKYSGDLSGAIWYSDTTAVVDSASLASELGWEVFNVMVPNPIGTVQYWNKNQTYVEQGAIRINGSVGLKRAPGIPGVAPVVLASAKIAYYDSTIVKSGTYTLDGNANVKLGFTANITDTQGNAFFGLNATLEKL